MVIVLICPTACERPIVETILGCATRHQAVSVPTPPQSGMFRFKLLHRTIGLIMLCIVIQCATMVQPDKLSKIKKIVVKASKRQ